MAIQHGLPESDVRPLPRVDGCIRLGRKMAKVLERHSEADSPERWLAAKVTVLADELAGLVGDDLERRGAPLVEAVTALWAYRWDFPVAARPFPMFEPALYAVQYLDRDTSHPRSQNADGKAARRTPGPQIDDPSAYVAGRIDAALAFLIDASLLKAVRSALETAADWISLARAAGFDNSFELATIERFGMMAELDSLEGASPDEVARETDKLQAMIELASFLKPASIP